jgi:sugar-specific transcriptional regulator TrmB
MHTDTVTRDNITILTKELGLSSFESKAYACFFFDGSILTAKDIANNSKIPLARVYEVLNSLEEKGLIKIDRLSNPIRYILNNPKRSLTLILNRQKEAMLKEMNEKESIIEELDRYYKSNRSADKNVEWNIYDIEDIDRFYNNVMPMLIKTATKEVIIVGKNLIDTLNENFLTEVRDVISKGVRLRAVTTQDSIKALLDADEDYVLQRKMMIAKILQSCDDNSDAIELRISGKMDTVPFGIVDMERVSFAVPSPLTNKYIVMIDTNKKSVVNEFYAIFNSMWSNTEPLDLFGLLDTLSDHIRSYDYNPH